MATEYFTPSYWKAKATASKPEKPVLSEEDEAFLNQITSDESPPPLPARPNVMDLPVAGETRGNDAQIALLDGAHNIALPDTPEEGSQISQEPVALADALEKPKKTRSTWSWLRRDSRDTKRKATASGLQDIAASLKSADATPNEDHIVDEVEAKKEEDDMTMVLERLNLAAVNNRVFSISDETQELLQKFNQVFKDLVHGVPTAYDDLESLLTNGDQQLQKTYNSLPDFLQKLIERLPETLTKGIAPTMLAAASERAEKSGVNMQAAGKAAGVAKKMGFRTPNLKDLIGKPGAVAGMLRSIITFLRARFPAFMGMNVLWSLALFVLLFVFWYCHKRGREARLEKERELTEDEVSKLEKEYESSDMQKRTTTAPYGASMEDVEAGMIDAQAARQAAATDDSTTPTDPNKAP